MSESFIGEIRMFAGARAPRKWAFCDGQILNVNENPSLYALLYNRYGGDGVTTFALPDLRGRLPLSQGAGSGLSHRYIGMRGGVEAVPLGIGGMPKHTHRLQAVNAEATQSSPQDHMLAQANETAPYYSTSEEDTQMNSSAITETGSSRAHDNLMPTLCVNFIISLSGTFPPRN